MFNDWYVKFAPTVYVSARQEPKDLVVRTFIQTNYLRGFGAQELLKHPEMLPALRMCTSPPLAVDRLSGLAGVGRTIVQSLEQGQWPPRLTQIVRKDCASKLFQVIQALADPYVFPWLQSNSTPSQQQIEIATELVADRLCTSIANPIIRNEQERRQLMRLGDWLVEKGYREIRDSERVSATSMSPGTFTFRLTVPGLNEEGDTVNIPVDAVVMPRKAAPGDLPLFIEAKSAGDFANVNKRRKEEASKAHNLRRGVRPDATLTLLLGGYFNETYLKYEASEGMHWVWEHRLSDFEDLGL